MQFSDLTWINNQEQRASELAELLDDHRSEIAATWSKLIYENASFHPDDLWLEQLVYSTKRGLEGLSCALTAGSYDELTEYLRDLSTTTMRSGFESSEVIEALLLCKDAVLPQISKVYAADTGAALAVTSTLDTCLRWIAGHFNSLHGTAMNRQMREQHERIVTMLKMGQCAPDALDLEEVLHYVAEGIIAAAQVDHCDFYLAYEDDGRLAPKAGIRRVPVPQVTDACFRANYPDIEADPLLNEVLRRKEPIAVYDVHNDPRLDPQVMNMMDTKSMLMVPLVTHDRVLGVAVTGTFSEYRAFTGDQIELVWDIARTAALVIENARLYDKIRYMAVLEERERLAREIHDNLAQALSVVNLQTSHIETLLQQGEVEQAQVFLSEMKHLVAEAHVDARDAIYSLRNGGSSVMAFIPALRSYLDRYRNTYGLDTQLITHDDRPILLPNEAIVQLTRIIQEGLTNVRKHADATEVRVELERHSDCLRIAIQDNGCGFDLQLLESTQDGGVGLQVMRERAECLGGRLEVQTAPGLGTTVIAWIRLEDRR